MTWNSWEPSATWHTWAQFMICTHMYHFMICTHILPVHDLEPMKPDINSLDAKIMIIKIWKWSISHPKLAWNSKRSFQGWRRHPRPPFLKPSSSCNHHLPERMRKWGPNDVSYKPVVPSKIPIGSTKTTNWAEKASHKLLRLDRTNLNFPEGEETPTKWYSVIPQVRYILHRSRDVHSSPDRFYSFPQPSLPGFTE